mgnify:FL=1
MEELVEKSTPRDDGHVGPGWARGRAVCRSPMPAPGAGPAHGDNRAMNTFTQVQLFTDTDGRARFREVQIPLSEGTPAARLSQLMPAAALQLRESPVGFKSDFHCTGHPQWLFVLRGRMEIGLQDGSTRVFGPGEHFYSADTLPEGAVFDPTLHGHPSRQLGDEPLVTLFVRA